mgnify:FL=1
MKALPPRGVYFLVCAALTLLVGFTFGYNVAAMHTSSAADDGADHAWAPHETRPLTTMTARREAAPVQRERGALRTTVVRCPQCITVPPTASIGAEDGVACPKRGHADAARAASGGFFDDVDDYVWAMFQQRHAEQMVKQTERYGGKGGFSERPGRVWYQNNWEPSFTCQHERRVGRMGDGGKWICDPHRIRRRVESELAQRTKATAAAAAAALPPPRGCLVYSVGSDNDFSFEESVRSEISPACEVHTFDPSVGAEPSNKPEWVAFHPWGVSSVAGAVAGEAHDSERNAAMADGLFLTLTEISARLGHRCVMEYSYFSPLFF